MDIHPAVRTVFFHELGHFIAREINLKHFGVMGGTKEITLYPSKHLGRYDGVTIPIVPDGEDPDKPTINVAEQFAVIPYGCFLESIFLQREFKVCFSPDNSGGLDLNSWSKLKEKLRDRNGLWESVQQYANDLKEAQCFNEIFELNVESFLIELEDGKYQVDLDKLREAIKPFIERHEEVYLSFVNRIRSYIC